MYKVAAIGDADSLAGLSCIGIETFTAYTAEEAGHCLEQAARSDYAVIFVTEAVCALIPDAVDKYRGEPVPAVIPIPGTTGNTGLGMRQVSKSVEQAVGSDILRS